MKNFNKTQILEALKISLPRPLLRYAGIYMFSLLIILSALLLYRELGPKYEYFNADSENGLIVYRYNKFDKSFDRCFINRHRNENTHLQKLDKSGVSETLMCRTSYEFTQDDLSEAEILELMEELERRKNEGQKDD